MPGTQQFARLKGGTVALDTPVSGSTRYHNLIMTDQASDLFLRNENESNQSTSRSSSNQTLTSNEGVDLISRTSNFGGETLRRPREHFHNVIRGLQPLVNRPELNGVSARNLASWLDFETTDNPILSVQDRQNDENAVIINMMDSVDESTASTGSNVDNPRNPAENITNAQNEPNRGSIDSNISRHSENLRSSPEIQSLIAIAEKYIGFVLVLLLKNLFDHKLGILILFGLALTFFYANGVVKREVAKQHKRYLISLLTATINLVFCIFFIYYVFDDQQFQVAILLVPVCNRPLDFGELLWIVIVTDFILKYITMLLKIFVLVIPQQLIPYQKKGKYYLFLERTSQLYRLIAPIQPWVCYLTEQYEGNEKLFSVLLSAIYIIFKANPLLKQLRAWKIAICKLLEPVNYGSKPTWEQLKLAGESCPICQDSFKNPTILNCKHVFCEECVATWFDREKTCPMCRAEVADDPAWKDGATTLKPQIF
ncbi:RING finger and transmembrane domain-containing protein 2 [Nymphon striatum]|nr:RING finger and transmembrane domain-containing protein 2 [Nymphon striatum]